VANLEALLPQVDFLSLHLPAMPSGQSGALIGRTQLALMKPTAYVINTGRGSLIDLDALTESLAAGRLAGAGLDVFPDEPVTKEKLDAMAHPLYSLRNVICTPHVAGISEEAGLRSCQMGIAAFTATMRGERAPGALNPEVYG
jgi:D-3-phosphoglycerate dehydrogenase